MSSHGRPRSGSGYSHGAGPPPGGPDNRQYAQQMPAGYPQGPPPYPPQMMPQDPRRQRSFHSHTGMVPPQSPSPRYAPQFDARSAYGAQPFVSPTGPPRARSQYVYPSMGPPPGPAYFDHAPAMHAAPPPVMHSPYAAPPQSPHPGRSLPVGGPMPRSRGRPQAPAFFAGDESGAAYRPELMGFRGVVPSRVERRANPDGMPSQPQRLASRNGSLDDTHGYDGTNFHGVPNRIYVDPEDDDLMEDSQADDEYMTMASADGSSLPSKRYTTAAEAELKAFEGVDPSAAIEKGAARAKEDGMLRYDRPQKRKKNKPKFADDIKVFSRKQEPKGAAFWRNLSKCLTCCIPNACIKAEAEDENKIAGIKQAWREKVTICIIVLLISLFVVGGIGFLPIYFCRSASLFTDSVDSNHKEPWMIIFGTKYDAKSYADKHPGGSNFIRDFYERDASVFFPRRPPSSLPSFCVDPNKDVSQFDEPSCPQLSFFNETDEQAFCHTNIVGPEGVRDMFGNVPQETSRVPLWEVRSAQGIDFITINNTIYDVTQYIIELRNNETERIERTHENANAYLDERLHDLIVNKLGEDASALYNEVFNTSDYKECLDHMFFHGTIDTAGDDICDTIGIAMYFLLFLVTFIMLVQVLSSLLYLHRKAPNFTPEDRQAKVMIMVPCYNESDDELRKTIDSVIVNDYPEENRVLVVVADGVITGHGETQSTPEILGNILGFKFNNMDEAFQYKSLGKKTDNYITAYSGIYEKEVKEIEEVEGITRRLNYVVLIKQGAMEDRGTKKAGNRGKRDSQLVIAGMLNRLQYNRKPTELDMLVQKELGQLGVPLKEIEYMMAIDADTRVDSDAMKHMVYHLEHNKKVLACCGETQVDNKWDSWVSMMQVFEYFSSHHMKKAFESVFGCVTCLPGCFTMYRLFTESAHPLISSDDILVEYSRNDITSLHEMNLFELGEDRMLTTLLLQNFPDMRLSFVPEAICWTIVPNTFSILLSQRRRWINSTMHNMFELLKVGTMCGICCISMKSIVIADLLATIILPSSIAYLGYLTYLYASGSETIDSLILWFYCLTITLMIIPFVVRRRFDCFLWFIIYVFLGIPVFYLYLPIYSFLHMDDFSWGKTRQVSGEDQAKENVMPKEDVETSVAKDSEDGTSQDSRNDENKSSGGNSSNNTDGDEQVNQQGASVAGSVNQRRRAARADSETDEVASLSTRRSRTRVATVRSTDMGDAESVVSHNTLNTRASSKKTLVSKFRNGPGSVDGSVKRSSPKVGDRRSSTAATVEAITVGTDSGEVLVYFRCMDADKQPDIAPVFAQINESEDLRNLYSIDAVLTRPHPDDPALSLAADADDPIAKGSWYVFVRLTQSEKERTAAFRYKHADILCTFMQRLCKSNRAMPNLKFRFGEDITREDSQEPLADHVNTSHAIDYIMSVNDDMTHDSLAVDRDTLSLYFGEDRVFEARRALRR